MKKLVLLTKDDSLRREMAETLTPDYRILRETSGREPFVFVDLDTLGVSVIRRLSGETLAVAVTKQKRTETVMEATTAGAYEVLQRPLQRHVVSETLSSLESSSSEMEDVIPVTTLPPTATCAIVGQSPVIMDVCKRLARLSQVDAPVLITGETGTGKELIAESIAQLSSRFGKPFVVVNCAAVPESLLESELFGFAKGSFTGAASAKEGMLAVADEGTVFFDEVGELPLALQGKLLRFLQTQTFYPLGSVREVQVDVRVVSATNRDLNAMVREGRFREDLYHRLRVTAIHIPPLRDHKKDIPLLVQFFIGRYRHTAPRPLKGFSKAFLKRLLSYDWPGNIRELENTVRSALALCKTDYLTTQELKELGSYPSVREVSGSESIAPVVVAYAREAVERKEKNLYDRIHGAVDRALFDYLLSHTKENRSEAARILGISRLTLRKKAGL